MNIETQIARLQNSLDDFERCVRSLEDRLFLAQISRWSTRDIVAHLIGWNRYLVEGAKQIRRAELPFYDEDPGENYSKVNSTLIREYPSPERADLLADLRASALELKRFLRTLDPGEWDRDFGVKHRGATVTIRNSIDELIDDYAHHRQQIVNWMNSRSDE